MDNDVSDVATYDDASAATPTVSGSQTYTWTIELFQRRGTCWLQWSTTAPFRAAQSKAGLYKAGPDAGSPFPTDPTQATALAWATDQQPWDTGQLWGSGWCAALIAEVSLPGGPYAYIAQTPVTTDDSD
jgi:hypothetical protein